MSDEALRDLVERALAEDIGSGDITSQATVPEDAQATARILQKAPGIIFGLDAVEETLSQAGVEDFEGLIDEGQWRDDVPLAVASANGSARGLLAGERTAMNLLGHLSGIATLTARYVRAVEGTNAEILDTRKTTPGLRVLEKAAVFAGGGTNHRMGLDDAVLIKDNHIALAGGLEEAVESAREENPARLIEVECRNAEEVAAALEVGANRLLLDNMELWDLREAVATRNERGEDAKLEASGGVTLGIVAEVAATGVDFISVGALTHSAPALDVSMDLE